MRVLIIVGLCFALGTGILLIRLNERVTLLESRIGITEQERDDLLGKILVDPSDSLTADFRSELFNATIGYSDPYDMPNDIPSIEARILSLHIATNKNAYTGIRNQKALESLDFQFDYFKETSRLR